MRATTFSSISDFFENVLKLFHRISSMLDKSMKLFQVPILRFSPIPRTPNAMMHPRTPGSMMGSPCVFASSLNRGCGDSDALRKKFQTFVHDWIVGWTKVRTIFWIFHVYQNREKKCKIWNRKFGFRILDFGIHTDPWGPPRGGAQGRHHHKGGNSGAVLTKMLSLNGRPWRSTTVDKTARS